MELLELQLQAKQGQIVAAKVYGPANISGPNAGLIWSKANMMWFKYGSIAITSHLLSNWLPL